MIIDLERLESMDASARHINTYQKEWPNGCELNRENIERAIAVKFGVHWLVQSLLSGIALSGYKSKRNGIYGKYLAERELIVSKYSLEISRLYSESREELLPVEENYKAKMTPMMEEYQSKYIPILAEQQTKLESARMKCHAETDQLGVESLAMYKLIQEKFTEECDQINTDFQVKLSPFAAEYGENVKEVDTEYKSKTEAIEKEYKERRDPFYVAYQVELNPIYEKYQAETNELMISTLINYSE